MYFIIWKVCACACMGENYSTIRREDKVNARTNTWMDEKESHKAILIMWGRNVSRFENMNPTWLIRAEKAEKMHVYLMSWLNCILHFLEWKRKLAFWLLIQYALKTVQYHHKMQSFHILSRHLMLKNLQHILPWFVLLFATIFSNPFPSSSHEEY